MRVLVIGLGYMGMPLARALTAQGHTVFGMKRSHADPKALVAEKIQPLTADISRAETLRAIQPDFDIVFNLASSSKGGVEDYQSVYRDGAMNLCEWLGGSPIQKYIHAGSTSVYGQSDGCVVDELSPRQPGSPTSKVLVETEDYLMQQPRNGFPAIIARLAGIYGPGRGHLFQQFLAGEARLDGDGGRFLNMIHLDDAVEAMLAAMQHARPGDAVNVADDEPVTQRAFFEWLAKTLGRPLPSPRDPSVSPPRKRGNTSKRISNRRLKEEWRAALRFPTFREGYGSEIARLTRMGQIGRGPNNAT